MKTKKLKKVLHKTMKIVRWMGNTLAKQRTTGKIYREAHGIDHSKTSLSVVVVVMRH